MQEHTEKAIMIIYHEANAIFMASLNPEKIIISLYWKPAKPHTVYAHCQGNNIVVKMSIYNHTSSIVSYMQVQQVSKAEVGGAKERKSMPGHNGQVFLAKLNSVIVICSITCNQSHLVQRRG